MIKLRDSEAQHLAALLTKIGRPRDDREAREMDHWLRRLRGERDDRTDL